MATSNQVENVLKRFNTKIERANEDLEELTDLVKELEKALTDYNTDEDLEITRGIKSEINQGKKQIDKLRKNIDKLEKELGDTNRKFQYLAT